MKKNIVLTGFMGTGKTSLGRMIAARLGCAFIDLDEMIEANQAMTIPEIFKLYGEAHFRQLERDAVDEVSNRHGIVIATGGGTVKDPQNIKRLRENGTIICLTTDVDELLKRTETRGERPALDAAHVDQGSRRAAIEKLLAERSQFYDQADYKLDTTNWSPLLLVDEIIKLAQR